MNTKTKAGFTIIEVMLFLAITGALTIGILVGSNVAISQQRYRDSVNSVKSYIQSQYSQVINVYNDETLNPSCSFKDGKVIFNSDETAKQARGTSNCLLLGRYILVEPTQLTSRSVIGLAKPDKDPNSSSLSINDFNLALVDPDVKTPEIEEVSWGAKIVAPKSDDGMTASILIVRSPISGDILTYVAKNNVKPSSLLNESNAVPITFCISSNGLAPTSSRRAVRIAARASSPTAVDIPLEKDNVCK